MTVLDRLRALRALLREPLRTALTLLGIIIGSGAIVLVVGLVAGAETAIVAANQSITGSDLVEVRKKELPARERLRGRPELDRADARSLGASWLSEGRELHAENHKTTRAEAGARKKDVRLVSAGVSSAALFKLELGQGRFINVEDVRLSRRVAVVGEEVWRELFDGAKLGPSTTFRTEGVLYQVIGVLAPKPMIGSTTGTNIWARKVQVPETTFDALYAPDHGVRRLVVRSAPARPSVLALSVFRPWLTHFLERRHAGAKNFELDDAEARELEQTILRVIKLLLLASGILTLGTGAINVANVMFVSVAERTREIGLRRALGETERSIVAQFLLEAATLGLFGGLLGVLFGVGATFAAGFGLAQVFPAFVAEIEPWALGSGLCLSVLAGLVAGIVPALRAAHLDPVAALRAD